MENILNQEEANKKKGFRISIIFHAVILLLAFFVGCSHEPEKAADKQYAVAVNFQEIEFTRETSSNSTKAKAKSGKPKPKQDPVTEIKDKKVDQLEVKKPVVPKVPKPTPTVPKPTKPIISETTMEEAVVEAVEEQSIEIEEPELEPEPIPEPEPEPVPEPAPVQKENPYKGKSNSSDSEKQGDSPSVTDGPADGTGKGNNGDGPGNNAGGDDGDSGIGDGGIGTGEYDGSGNGVFGRKVVHRDISTILKADFKGQEGKKIVADYCVNRAGLVTYVEVNFDETTAEMTNAQYKQVLKGVSGYKVEPDLSAPKEQCGKMSVVLTQIDAFWGGE